MERALSFSLGTFCAEDKFALFYERTYDYRRNDNDAKNNERPIVGDSQYH